jgi:quinol monooxygenase YgiN
VEGHVSWVIELAVKNGALEAFKELMEEMVSGTGGEPETLAYEWYISGDQGTIHIYEKYADSEAWSLT